MVSKKDIADALGAGLTGVADAAKKWAART